MTDLRFIEDGSLVAPLLPEELHPVVASDSTITTQLIRPDFRMTQSFHKLCGRGSHWFDVGHGTTVTRACNEEPSRRIGMATHGANQNEFGQNLRRNATRRPETKLASMGPVPE